LTVENELSTINFQLSTKKELSSRRRNPVDTIYKPNPLSLSSDKGFLVGVELELIRDTKGEEHR